MLHGELWAPQVYDVLHDQNHTVADVFKVLEMRISEEEAKKSGLTKDMFVLINIPKSACA